MQTPALIIVHQWSSITSLSSGKVVIWGLLYHWNHERVHRCLKKEWKLCLQPPLCKSTLGSTYKEDFGVIMKWLWKSKPCKTLHMAGHFGYRLPNTHLTSSWKSDLLLSKSCPWLNKLGKDICVAGGMRRRNKSLGSMVRSSTSYCRTRGHL